MAAPAARSVERMLFIRGVPFTFGQREVREHFSKFGRVLRCDLVLNKETGFFKGFGWVTFVSKNSVQEALQKEEHFLDGYKIEVRQQSRKLSSTEEHDDV